MQEGGREGGREKGGLFKAKFLFWKTQIVTATIFFVLIPPPPSVPPGTTAGQTNLLAAIGGSLQQLARQPLVSAKIARWGGG